MAPTVMQPATLTGTGTRGMRNRSSSSSSSEQRRRRNAPIATGYTGSGFGTTGYNQTYAPTTMTSGTGQNLDTFNQTTTAKQSKPGFV